jgi:hypothetical protein
MNARDETQSSHEGNAGLLVDRQAAARAIEFTRPLLESAVVDMTVGQSGVFHVVIMDPAKPPGTCRFEEAILLEASFGKPRAEWDADYAMYARAKAELSWRTQRDSSAVQALSPHLLARGDLRVWGSVCLDGIVVALSGAEAEYDEALAGAIAMALRAVIKVKARAC